LKAQLKLHKPNIPIRPVVNNRTAPSYKIAKKLNNILKQHLNLDNSYTVENSTKLANDLVKITLKDSYSLITLDIKDLYVNIPIQETIQTTRSQLLKHNDRTFMNQLCSLETILNQNSFTYQNQIYQPTKGVAMGSPISGLIAEILLQSLEHTHTHIKPLLDTKRIILYTRYIDILIIYDTTQINLDTITRYANSINSNLELNPTPEKKNTVNFLDLTIIRNTPHFQIDVFRKPTTTDTTINYLSNHPQQHKLAAYRFLINRMHNLPLNKNHR